MHYFQFEIKEWLANTSHLTLEEEGAYLRLICYYYDSQKPIHMGDIDRVFRRCRVPDDLGANILHEFFQHTGDGMSWVHKRCDRVIAEYQARIEQASRAGRVSAQRKANGRTTVVQRSLELSSTESQPIINHESLINNHIDDNTTDVVSPPKVRKNGTRLSADWTLPKEWADWAKQERPDLNAQSVGDQFKDFWISKAGINATKLNWQATWRNWVRAQNAPRINPADAIRTTVPSTTERDPTLVRLEEERKNCKPPAPEVLAKMKALRGKVFGVNDNAKETL